MPGLDRLLTTEVVPSFTEVSTEDWDTMQRTSFFTSAQWLARVEGTPSQCNAYAVVRRNGRPVAGLAAYLSTSSSYHAMNPPRLFAQASVHNEITPFYTPVEQERVATLVERLAPALGECYPAAVCVCPYSREAGVTGELSSSLVADQLVDTFGQMARGWRARSSAVLYLPHQMSSALTSALVRHGYVPMVVS